MKTRKKLLIAAAIIAPILYINSLMGEPSLIDQTYYTTSQLNQEIEKKSEQLRHTTNSMERKELQEELNQLGEKLKYEAGGSQ